VGIGLLTTTFFLLYNNYKFLETAIISQGTVIGFEKYRSSDHSVLFRPIVKFIDEKGQNVEFVSNSANSRPQYQVGEKVEVIYNSIASNEAKINSFFEIWGVATITGIGGVGLFIFGWSNYVFDKKKRDLQQDLKQNGTTIETNFQSVVMNNNSTTKNSRNYYQIKSQWQNPVTSKMHVFTSDYIYYDPTDCIKTDKIKVLIDRNDPKKYSVDVSFLPEME
jgi:hypothetical protein